jgi:hypothetical protein
VIVNIVLVVPFNGFVVQLPFEGGGLTIKLINPILRLDPTE